MRSDRDRTPPFIRLAGSGSPRAYQRHGGRRQRATALALAVVATLAPLTFMRLRLTRSVSSGPEVFVSLQPAAKRPLPAMPPGARLPVPHERHPDERRIHDRLPLPAAPVERAPVQPAAQPEPAAPEGDGDPRPLDLSAATVQRGIQAAESQTSSRPGLLPAPSSAARLAQGVAGAAKPGCLAASGVEPVANVRLTGLFAAPVVASRMLTGGCR